MLKDSVVEISQYGPIEVVSAFTENKLAEKFRIEVTYATDAHKNGNPPILDARLYSNNYCDVRLEHSTATRMLRMCYRQHMNSHIK
ncbi:MAG: hypothetical protein NC548_63390 [Lachnospiraceae bacterium]|nr:hypothetical protein [Lachnospiraceae bacterium]